jgi:hypothetical protein
MQLSSDKMLAELSYTKGENAKLREQLAEAVGLLRDLPDMMGGDNWGDFLTLDDERRVLAVVDTNHDNPTT